MQPDSLFSTSTPTHAASPPITNHANHEISNLNGNLVLDSSDDIQDVTHASNLNNSTNETESTQSAHTSSIQNDVEPIQSTQPVRDRHALSYLRDYATLATINPIPSEPKTLKITFKVERWVNAMKDEIQALHENHTWELVSCPSNINIVGFGESARSNYWSENRSYVEVVKEAKPRVNMVSSVQERNLFLSWNVSEDEEEWLSKSTVGVLKDFSNMEVVNQKIEERGFRFSSSFLGGKSIVWTFESKYDIDGFIKNAFFFGETAF
ncbi:hypothetical protein LWI28_026261 [Acer negundo]|uniref:Uncharacterized protein n=1 Tax=Acer negundo TaxID=4023 RepID=A0AAD5NZ94_ACENE|nr:hypothetical protein LWI28_026261 [Acer negundo]